MLRLLLLFLLSVLESSAGSAAQTPLQVFAVAGEAVVLPCSLWNRALFDDSPTVEWTRADLKPKAALVYRDNGEIFEMKHQRFESRTSLFHSEVKDGNVSLRISDVQLSDAGMFHCLKIPMEHARDRIENSTVELVIALNPNIAVISFGDEKMVVECEARCWQTKPQMKILDDQGRTLIGEEMQTEDPGGCSTIKQRVTLQCSAQSRRIFCRVEFPQFNQSRATQILIPEHTKLDRRVQLFKADCLASYGTIACISSVILISFCGLFLLRKKLRRCAGSCLPHTITETYTNSSSFQQLRTDSIENMENCLLEQQERELNDLKSELQKKDVLITNLRRQLYASQHSREVFHRSKPTLSQEAPIEALGLLDSFENSASSSENDQDLLKDHKPLKPSSFTQKKQPRAEISVLRKESVLSSKNRKKKSVVRLSSYPGENVNSTQSSLLTSYQNNNSRERRVSLDPGNNVRKPFDKSD
uniref:Selection and upkeep of intraepithelial T-cells protein 1-like n=1 Tax=Oryzias melastigma TaxID=30732 RepID=A0A3B3E1U9_ORYME